MPHLLVTAPPGFRFLPTVLSHGWCVLPPFAYDEASATLSRWERLSDGSIVQLALRKGEDAETVDVDVSGLDALSAAQADEIRVVVARILSFEQPLQAFYDLVRDRPAYAWVERAGAGRMLVSPMVWEDLAKTLLTTNTTWRMTKDMVRRLTALGDPAADGVFTFPTPAQVAAHAPESLNAHVRAGYRGAYLHGLALAIAEERLDPEAWRDPALSSAEVYRQIRSVKGFGDYAAGALMRLLGRFDQLGLDSVCRTMFRKQWNQDQPATDRDIAAHYEPFGEWRGLAVWMDVIREDFG